MYSLLYVIGTFACGASALNNGVGKLPKLGYDTWNAFQCGYNGSLVLEQAKALQNYGLVGLGYDIIILDDCYAKMERNNKGEIVADPAKFPMGMPTLSREVNNHGVSLAAYSSNGWYTCAGYPGSYGHEETDLLTFNSWGMSYLKYDNCNAPADNITQENVYGRYVRMRSAIATVADLLQKRPFELGLCEWGVEYPWIWAAQIGQAWRIDGDVRPWWSSVAGVLMQASYAFYAGQFYGHNDLDMLEVGNTGIGTPPGNLTFDEAKTHFTSWALLKSPLIIGTDLTKATDETIEILSNKDLLKVNQDPHISESVYPFRGQGTIEFWTGNSSYGVVFMIINSQDTEQDMFFNLTESYLIRAGRTYSVYDMWSHTQNGTAVLNMTVTLPPHGVSALLLNDAGPDGLDSTCYQGSNCAYPNGTRFGTSY